MTLSSEILNYIKNNAGTSFVEIERIFERNGFDYKGELAITSDGFENLVYWQGWNKQAVNILNELLYNELIIRSATQPVIYYIDGKALDMPIAQHYRHYSHPRWFPISFSANKREMGYQ